MVLFKIFKIYNKIGNTKLMFFYIIFSESFIWRSSFTSLTLLEWDPPQYLSHSMLHISQIYWSSSISLTLTDPSPYISHKEILHHNSHTYPPPYLLYWLFIYHISHTSRSSFKSLILYILLHISHIYYISLTLTDPPPSLEDGLILLHFSHGYLLFQSYLTMIYSLT